MVLRPSKVQPSALRKILFRFFEEDLPFDQAPAAARESTNSTQRIGSGLLCTRSCSSRKIIFNSNVLICCLWPKLQVSVWFHGKSETKSSSSLGAGRMELGGWTAPFSQSKRTCSPLCSENRYNVWDTAGVTRVAARPPMLREASLAPMREEIGHRTLLWHKGNINPHDRISSLTLMGKGLHSPSPSFSIHVKVSCSKHIMLRRCMKGWTSKPVTPWSSFLETLFNLQTPDKRLASCLSFSNGAPARPLLLSSSVPHATNFSALSKDYFLRWGSRV